MSWVAKTCCALAIVAATVATAWADDPWAVGISPEQKLAAQKLLESGNALFLEKKYREALDQYVAATQQWDHPAIEFNIVRCLIQLEKPVEAFDHLELALHYGAAPLEEAVYQEALNYRKLLASQVGEIAVSCNQAGAKISLDGQLLIERCPGEQTRRLSIGRHQVVGVKSGFLTETREVVVLGGKPQPVAITLVALAAAAKVTHRWATWKPWLVFGGGLALVASGGGLDAIASSQMNAFDNSVASQCGGKGCNGPASTQTISTKQRDNAKLESEIGVGILSVGAAASITGIVLLYMNRAQTVYEHTEIVPTAGGVAVSITGSF